jgi:hypothetical protein
LFECLAGELYFPDEINDKLRMKDRKNKTNNKNKEASIRLKVNIKATVEVNIRQSLYRPGQALRVAGG